MRIGEIPVNERIQIRVVQGDLRFECEAIIVAKRDDKLYLSPIKHEGQIIDFRGDKLQILAFYVGNGGQAVGWSACRIKKDIVHGKLCHVLTSSRDSVRVNRRMEKRIRTDMRAALRTMSMEKEVEINLKNYSLGGVGFVSALDIRESEFYPVALLFADHVQGFRISMRIHILRKLPYQDNLFYYGAQITPAEDRWVDYVQKKMTDLQARQKKPDLSAQF